MIILAATVLRAANPNLIPDATDLWQLCGDIPPLIRWMALLSVALTAASIIRKQAILPLLAATKTIYRGAESAIQSIEVCREMAKEFGRNGGSTLRDTVDEIKEMATLSAQKADAAAALAQTAVTRAEEVHVVVDEILKMKQEEAAAKAR